MVRKKSAFTLVEVLFATGIFSMVITIGISILLHMDYVMYNGQINSSNRRNLNELIYIISQEIQSSDAIRISSDGKTMKIRQNGQPDFSIAYKIQKNGVSSFMTVNTTHLINVVYENSGFLLNENKIGISLESTSDTSSLAARRIHLDILPRNVSAKLEVKDD